MKTCLEDTICAFCERLEEFDILYKANFGKGDFSKEVFSARRLPDRCHYQMVRCRTCGLVRSHPRINVEGLTQLYEESAFTYQGEVEALKKTYGNYLEILRKVLPSNSKKKLLEIGCGNGFMLDWALEHGWEDVAGVEPSADSIEKALPRVRNKIVPRMFEPGLFKENTFDAVALFQVFDHLPNPNETLEEILQVLKPGGVVLAINHNVGALGSRLLKSRCPIIDIEHTYLYDKKTMAKFFKKKSFKVLRVFSVTNHYSLSYWCQLMPLGKTLKKALMHFLKKTGVGKIEIPLRVGNLGLIAQKPSDL